VCACVYGVCVNVRILSAKMITSAQNVSKRASVLQQFCVILHNIYRILQNTPDM
jgi:hypothetical protein